MLLPALNKARERGQGVRCISNLKQCMSGAQLYATDYADQLIVRFDANQSYREYLEKLRYITDPVSFCPSVKLTTTKGVEKAYSREGYAILYSFHVRFCQATFVTFFQFFLYSKRNSPYPCNHRCRFLLKSKLIVSLFLFFKRYFLALHTGSG